MLWSSVTNVCVIHKSAYLKGQWETHWDVSTNILKPCDQIIYEKEEEEYRNWNVSQVIQTVRFKVSCVIKAGFVTCNSGFLQGLTDAYVMLMGFRNKTDHICSLKIGNKGTVPRKKKKKGLP